MSYGKKALGAGLGYALAGPAGALVGLSLAGTDSDEGYDMSDIPFGIHVEADYEDDEVGRRWTLSFLSPVPAHASAWLRLLADTGQGLRGRAPFSDFSGEFVASASIAQGNCTLFVPLGVVAYTSPKNISLEVSVWVTRHGGATPVGKAVLDAALPQPRPWRMQDYLLPLISLSARVVMAAGGGVDGPAIDGIMLRLGDALGFDHVSSAPPGKMLSVERAVQMARFRFPGLAAEALEQLLLHAACPKGDITESQRALLDEVAARLAASAQGATPSLRP